MCVYCVHVCNIYVWFLCVCVCTCVCLCHSAHGEVKGQPWLLGLSFHPFEAGFIVVHCGQCQVSWPASFQGFWLSPISLEEHWSLVAAPASGFKWTEWVFAQVLSPLSHLASLVLNILAIIFLPFLWLSVTSQ